MYPVRFDENDFLKYHKAPMYGRICDYSMSRGYGFIFAENGKELFFSSYNVLSKEKHLFFGSTVRFTVAKRENYYEAKDVEIIDNSQKQDIFLTPKGETIKVKKIRKIGLISGYTCLKKLNLTLEEIEKKGYQISDFEYLFIETHKGNYRFFNEGSPATGDGQMDVKKTYQELREKYILLY